MEINPIELSIKDVYKLMIGSIVPRPIAWVSTISKDGIPNLAPFSYFNAISSRPATVMFSTSIREGAPPVKDTYANIVDTGEFIVNFVTEELAEAMNITAGVVPPEVNEFERANLSTAPAKVVNVPRVAASPIHFECQLNQVITIGEDVGGAHLIIGTVLHIHVDDAIYQEGGKIDIEAYKPVGRLAGNAYTRVNDLFTLIRPPSER